MSFTITEQKSYAKPREQVFSAARGAVLGLEGNILEEDSEEGMLVAKFHKTILKKTLGDRTQMTVTVGEEGGETAVHVSCYPLNAVGQKLMFGARKGVSRTVVNWFFAHLEHRLPKD